MKRSFLFCLLALLAALPPLSAGTVYVPLAKHQAGDQTYRTQVWVTNTGDVTRRFSAVFLPAWADGTRGRTAAEPRDVAGRGTLLLGSFAPGDQQGMLEITGAPQLAISASLQAGGGVSSAAAHVPVISSENKVPGGGTVSLLGLERSPGGAVTHLGLVNLAHRAQTCTVRAFRADGSQIAQTAVLPLPPLTLSDFSDAFAILGETSLTSARFAVSCEADFYAYAAVLDPAGRGARYVTPAESATSTLQPPGTTPAPPPPPPAPSGTVLLERPGTFFAPSRGDSYLAIDLPAEAGRPYKKVVVEFDLFLRRWQTDFFHSITSLRRPSASRNERILYYGVQIRGDNSKTTLDLGVHDVFVKGTGPWEQGHTYRLRLEYDLEARQVAMKVWENGVLEQSLIGRAQHLDLSANANPLRIDFGQDGIVPDSYYPPIGWLYSNLRATAEPAED